MGSTYHAVAGILRADAFTVATIWIINTACTTQFFYQKGLDVGLVVQEIELQSEVDWKYVDIIM